MPHSSRVNQVRNPVRSGFTLIELLAVMLALAILFLIAIPRMDRGPALSTSQSLMEALFSEARTTAIGGGKRTRVVIHNDLSDADNPERYLRFVAVATEETDAEGKSTGFWRTAGSEGEYLSPGVFFDHEASQRASSTVDTSNPPPPESTSITGFGSWEEGFVDFPGPPKSEQACYYYEFNSEGICVQDGSTTPGAVVVLSRGHAQVNQDPVLDPAEKAGFLVLRNGSTSLYRDIRDLKQ